MTMVSKMVNYYCKSKEEREKEINRKKQKTLDFCGKVCYTIIRKKNKIV